MIPDDDTLRLFELLTGRSDKKGESRELARRSNSLHEFRILLVSENRGREPLSSVYQHWQRQLKKGRSETDDRKLMHDLEILSRNQAELEKLLRATEATLLNKLAIIDASAADLVALSTKVIEMRAAISEYRKRVAELAMIHNTTEVDNRALPRTGT